MDLLEEFKRARDDADAKFTLWNLAEAEYEDAAWMAYAQARDRLNRLVQALKLVNVHVSEEMLHAGWYVAS